MVSKEKYAAFLNFSTLLLHCNDVEAKLSEWWEERKKVLKMEIHMVTPGLPVQCGLMGVFHSEGKHVGTLLAPHQPPLASLLLIRLPLQRTAEFKHLREPESARHPEPARWQFNCLLLRWTRNSLRGTCFSSNCPEECEHWFLPLLSWKCLCYSYRHPPIKSSYRPFVGHILTILILPDIKLLLSFILVIYDQFIKPSLNNSQL